MPVMSLRGYARHRGVALSAVQKAIESKRISALQDGQIESEIADAEWARNTAPRPGVADKRTPQRSTQAHASESAPRLDGGGALEYSRARAVRENYLARLAKIEFEERSGKLVSRDEIEVAAFNRYRTFRDGMLNIPDRLAAVLASETDPVRVFELLSAEIRKALLEVADDNR